MKVLNVACASERPKDPRWINIDRLKSQFPEGTPERRKIDAEKNYLEHDLLKPLPFDDTSVDGVLCSHILEHFDCQEAVKIIRECYRVMKPGAYLIASVPDTSYFRKVYPQDRNENWPVLFDTTDQNNPIPTFFEAALFFNEHKQVLTEDSLWALLVSAGFQSCAVQPVSSSEGVPADLMKALLNREKFSVMLAARK